MQSGFSNVSLDLIYGIPGMDVSGWKRNLDTAFSLGIQHISAYHLTIEPHTALSRMVGRGLLQLPEEDTSTKQFLMLHHMALEHGFVHYEISNLAKAGFISKHNTGYWKDKKYLGIGPSAHSFDGLTRQWNVPDTQKYIASVNQGQSYYESEKLDRKMRFNEYIMVSLRTMWGVDTTYITGEFGKAAAIHFRSSVRPFLETGILLEHNGSITMTPEGWLISDYIITRLMQE
jgi:oxygen-independent coproporphyrinogen-3 oxidase